MTGPILRGGSLSKIPEETRSLMGAMNSKGGGGPEPPTGPPTFNLALAHAPPPDEKEEEDGRSTGQEHWQRGHRSYDAEPGQCYTASLGVDHHYGGGGEGGDDEEDDEDLARDPPPSYPRTVRSGGESTGGPGGVEEVKEEEEGGGGAEEEEEAEDVKEEEDSSAPQRGVLHRSAENLARTSARSRRGGRGGEDSSAPQRRVHRSTGMRGADFPQRTEADAPATVAAPAQEKEDYYTPKVRTMDPDADGRWGSSNFEAFMDDPNSQ